jgi:preprotein translocase subunit SecG
MLYNILITFHILVCIALIGVVLMQRSEGGALGMGGGPQGFMTARGAGDLLTRTTWILFAVFLALSIGLTLYGTHAKNATGLKIDRIDPSILGKKPPAGQPSQLPAAPSGLPAPLTAPSAPTNP